MKKHYLKVELEAVTKRYLVELIKYAVGKSTVRAFISFLM